MTRRQNLVAVCLSLTLVMLIAAVMFALR